jgi:hypothetical protein
VLLFRFIMNEKNGGSMICSSNFTRIMQLFWYLISDNSQTNLTILIVDIGYTENVCKRLLYEG